MNSEKILIEINVAGVNRSFDCIVPRTLPAKLLCRGFLELVEQSMGIPFGAYRQALLMSERTGRILSPEQTLDDADIDSGDAIPALEELADKLVTAHTADPAAARDALLHTMACKAAIKGGWKSDLSELRVLVDKVQSGEVQFCPHGRPVKAKLTKYELEKMFKRA